MSVGRLREKLGSEFVCLALIVIYFVFFFFFSDWENINRNMTLCEEKMSLWRTPNILLSPKQNETRLASNQR